MANSLQQLHIQAADMNVRIERLKKTRQQLILARRDMEHQLRRCNDGLERVGGHSKELELKASMLNKNRQLILRDEKNNQWELEKLNDQLKAIDEKIRARTCS